MWKAKTSVEHCSGGLMRPPLWKHQSQKGLLSADDPRNVLIKAQRTIGNNTIKVEQQKAAALGRGAGTTGRGNGTELPRV